MFKQRLIEPELLDHADPAEARKNLADIIRLNRRFGGYSAATRALSKVAMPDEKFTLLDVGAASGDTGTVFRERYPKACVVSLDYNEVNAAMAPKPKLIADAFELPFGRASFDYVFASLFLHHFENDQVVRLLRGFAEVARKAVLITDLERHPIAYLFLPLTRPILKWSRMTVSDGCTSVRAAFTASELTELARQAGMQDVSVEVHRPAFRLSMVARN